MTRARLALVALGLVLAQAGCTDAVECSQGTYREGDSCRAGVAPSCGAGTVLENGECVPAGQGGGQCGAGTHLEGDTCVADVSAAGNAARFANVHLTAPTQFVAVADASLHNSFESGSNLAFLGLYAPTDRAVRLYGGSGTRRGDGTYQLDRASAFDVAATAAADGTLATEEFNFALSGFGSSTPVALVATTLRQVHTTSQDGVTLVDAALLSGVLTRAAAEAVFIDQANSTLLGLLESFGIEPDVDQDGNGTAESWRLSLSIGATPVWLF